MYTNTQTPVRVFPASALFVRRFLSPFNFLFRNWSPSFRLSIAFIGLFLVGLSNINAAAYGQRAADSTFLDLDKDLGEQLLPFEEIYQIAVRHSPSVRLEYTYAEGKAQNIPQAKILFLHGTNLVASLNQGNQAMVSTGTNNTEYLQIANGYRLGFQVALPLDYLLTRRSYIRQAEADHRAALERAEVVKLTLKRDLNRTYHLLLTSQRLLKIYFLDEQASLVAFRKAEIEWQNGRTTVEEYAAASRSYRDVQSQIEVERGNFLTNLYDLTAQVGVNLEQLKRVKL